MAILEALRMAIGTMRGNKTRTALTLLGIVIGVFAIIVSVTAVKVIDIYFRESLQFLGSSTFTISRYPSIQINGNRGSRNRPNITYDQVEKLRRNMELPVAISILENFQMGSVRYEGRETEPNIFMLGTDENFLGNFSYELDQGRFLTEEDVLYGRPVIVLGSETAEELFLNETPLGKQIRMSGHRYEVIGVLKSKGGFLGSSWDNRNYAPLTRLFTLYGQPGRDLSLVSMRVREQQLLPAAMEETTGRLRVIRKVPPGEDNNFELETNDTFRSIFDTFTSILTIAGLIIGLIALLASGVGVMNIMLVTVTERTREIGVRKSVGARRRDILRQVLFEGFFLCQIGGLIGIAIGALIGNLVAVYFDISAAFPWGWAFSAVVMMTFIALGFGGYPAFKAARLNPIDALRYE